MIKKEYIIKASPQVVFEALTSKSSVEKWTGTSAIMSNEKGSEFSLWNGSIVGRNIQINSNQIVQKWKESSWKDYSDVNFFISEIESGTKLTLEHTNIPESSIQSIDNGWDEYYLGPLKSFVESIKSN